MSNNSNERHTPFLIALMAGGLAGTTVDITLYPIDTLKTRLQSPQGFIKSGGFRGVYNGIGAAAIGSAPGAALFFSVYEYLKEYINNNDNGPGILGKDVSPMWGHMIAASVGEAAACLVRVPTEVLKQNMQTGTATSGGTTTLSQTWNKIIAQKSANSFASSIFGGLYRGYGITLMREIPFAFIQFPIYEQMKKSWAVYQKKEAVSPIQAALCGSVSGAFAAACTTPLDVIKTRLMIGKDANGVVYHNAVDVTRRVIQEEGWRTLLKGIEPRVMWISIGGFVFFGAYEEFRSLSMSMIGH
jgi:solute carrier family 25 S-adenosylmethionine transporter 26